MSFADWRRSIHNTRDTLQLVLDDSMTLQRQLPAILSEAYPRVRRQAHEHTGLPLATFPEGCPWAIAQVLDENFWPEA